MDATHCTLALPLTTPFPSLGPPWAALCAGEGWEQDQMVYGWLLQHLLALGHGPQGLSTRPIKPRHAGGVNLPYASLPPSDSPLTWVNGSLMRCELVPFQRDPRAPMHC